MPSALVDSVLVKPVASFRAVIDTPGIALPCPSRRRPLIVPVVCCANAGMQASSQNSAAPNRCLVIPRPPVCDKGTRAQLTVLTPDQNNDSGGGVKKKRGGGCPPPFPAYPAGLAVVRT